MNYFVYILYSKKLNRYYIGATSDLASRMESHLWMHNGFTSKAKDWELKYSEAFKQKSEAFSRERQIKKWKSRIMIEKLIASG